MILSMRVRMSEDVRLQTDVEVYVLTRELPGVALVNISNE